MTDATRVAGLALLVAVAGLLAPVGAAATVPGDNGPIVWQSQTGDTGGLNEIWIMDADGGNQEGLTDNAFNDERPAISAAGDKVVFQAFRTGDGMVDSWEIYKMNADGSSQVALTDDDDTDFEPTFSTDGSTVVFMRQTTGVPSGEVAGQDLWAVPVSGGTAVNLTQTPDQYECCPEFSPDGTQIAFTNSGYVDGNPGPYDDNEIWVMDADGGNQDKLTDNTAQDVGPTWSPDGSRLAWVNADNGSLWTMDADGSDPAPLTTASTYYAPSWSPDGGSIAVQVGNEIVAVDVDTPTSVTNLSNNAVQDQYPSWAPSGGAGGRPDTVITKKPKAVIHKDKATYEFEAVPPAGASFECKLDGKPYKPCSSPKELKNLAKGKHKFRAQASSGGQTDPSPAKHTFKVKP